MGEWLRHRLPDRVDVGGMLVDARFVRDDGSPVREDDPYRPHTFIWFHRDLREEPVVPGALDVLHRDERLVVVDKPPFLSTIPRGRHVAQSVVVRLRDELGLPELSPAHRLDRITSGVLVLTTERRWRGAYQSLFQERAVAKAYLALARHDPRLRLPLVVRNHLRKARGAWQVEVVPDAPVNAETLVELDHVVGEQAVYRLTPRTGQTHQLRVHLAGLGLPIVGDPLYPEVLDVEVDDFRSPLQLLAHELAFTDPVDGAERRFRSRRVLPLVPE
ncbi:pseudouridine synthase [Aeromicrobium sp. Leaf350]|uniref:pseudouridine synthase n=1 Tax=Aeromicrobium sp. Leaf350 TaxID=2876565 RepID=UPI001E4D3516|nr:pseudouridine synthase [Aeromicrobium sp. Leaf350]